MQINKNRPLIEGQRVHVYFNLHQGGYSIRDKKTGLVVAYAESVLLKNCKFKVSQSGRQKTISERRKRVHAHVEGDFIAADQEQDLSSLNKIYYNPYLTEQFTDTSNNSWIFDSSLVFFKGKVCYAEVEEVLL